MSDNLIYAMSTSGSMNIDRFSELFKYVYYPYASHNEDQMDINAKQQAIRILDSLGYCEFDFGKRTVHMCKPSLVLIPSIGLPTALLVGARTPNLVKKLKAAVNDRRNKVIIEYRQHKANSAAIPATICIQATDKTIIQEIAGEAGIACDVTTPAAWRIADMSQNLDGAKEALLFSKRVEPDWKKRMFNNNRLMFSGHQGEESSQFLTEYLHPITKQYHHWIWKDGNAAETNRDWGRYFALENSGDSILMFDEKRFKLAVPVTVPLPCLLARAAALCSGIPPSIVASCKTKIGAVPPGHLLQVYSGVTPGIAGLIANKLNQKLIDTRILSDRIEVPHA